MFRKPLHSLLLLSTPALFVACSDDSKPDPAVLILDRESLDFGELEVGQSSAEHLFTVRNASPFAVESVSVELTGTPFAITANTCERFLDAGMECEVRVKFQPRIAGPHEARLKVLGAPDVDETVLKGLAMAWVDVRDVPAGARVVAEGDAWSCNQPCKMPVRKAQVTLRAAPTGFPTWGGHCVAAAGGGCSLVMDGTKVVSLQALAPLFQWELRRDSHPRSVEVTPDGDLLVQEVGQLLRLTRNGQVLWSVPLSGGVKVALDGQGHTYVVDYYGKVTRYDASGQVQWAYSPVVDNPSWHELAVSANGHVYVLLNVSRPDNSRQLRLVALSPQGSERWSLLFDEGHFNYASGLKVDAQGEVYVSGSVFNRGAAAGETVFVKGYYRKYSAEGALRWDLRQSWSSFAVNAEGATSGLSSGNGGLGSFTLFWIGADGMTQWNVTVPSSPGGVSMQTFSPSGTLLFGGNEALGVNVEQGRGWFAAMNLQTRTLGPATYVDAPTGGPVRISGLTLTPTGNVVVIGGFGAHTDEGEGYIRMYDARVLAEGSR